ncbi:MAG: hypothetical protein SFT94_03040 [Pseudanabaenaceae cyanobacterium bins.68]|nr:hypothetical protein [Pseudanabaenaceae cyanobacterium bins.68]
MQKAILTAVIFTASTGMVTSASEAIQIGYDFDGQNGNPTQTDSNASLSVATLSGNSTSFTGTGNPGFAASISTSENFARLEFTVAPNTQLSLTNFSYDVADSVPESIRVSSSVDSFTSFLNTYTPTSTFTTRSFTLSSFNNISTPVTFRIEQFGFGTIRFDNVLLDFTPTAIPFEFSPTFAAAVLAGIWLTSKRLKAR